MLRESQIGRRLTRSPLQNPESYITAEKDAMQSDYVSELPPSDV